MYLLSYNILYCFYFYQEILHKLGGIEDLAQVRLLLW